MTLTMTDLEAALQDRTLNFENSKTSAVPWNTSSIPPDVARGPEKWWARLR